MSIKLFMGDKNFSCSITQNEGAPESEAQALRRLLDELEQFVAKVEKWPKH